VAAVALVAALSVATPASAHNYYISSIPAIDEVLTTLPEEFVVTTNDNLLDLAGSVGGFLMKVTGPDGLFYGDGCVKVSGSSVSMPAALGPAGDYTLEWQVVSADGHTISDTIAFQWQPAAGDESATPGSTTVPNCGSDTVIAPGNSVGNPEDEVMTDILWIAGAIGVVTVAVIATLLLIRPKKKGEVQ
jgi:methionine-rich copper-binding protein CopC